MLKGKSECFEEKVIEGRIRSVREREEERIRERIVKDAVMGC